MDLFLDWIIPTPLCYFRNQTNFPVFKKISPLVLHLSAVKRVFLVCCYYNKNFLTKSLNLHLFKLHLFFCVSFSMLITMGINCIKTGKRPAFMAYSNSYLQEQTLFTINQITYHSFEFFLPVGQYVQLEVSYWKSQLNGGT